MGGGLLMFCASFLVPMSVMVGLTQILMILSMILIVKVETLFH